MKKLILISLLLYGIVLGGCSNNKQEVELLKQQNALLQEQVNNKKSEDDLFTKQNECKSICEKVYKDDEKGISSIPNTFALSPEYAYSKDKNACFYAGGLTISSNNNVSENKWITNCQTNQKVLVLYMTNNIVDSNSSNCNRINCAKSIEEYNLQKQEFMGQ